MQESQEVPIVIQPPKKPVASIIWLHGLGARGDDLAPIGSELVARLPEVFAVRHVFPQAPTRPVTINQGYAMPAWYDINGGELVNREDQIGILASEELIKGYIASEIAAGFLPQQIYLAGFSQGGAMALFTALRYPKQLGGVIALSCYLPLSRQHPPNGLHKDLPIFMGVGTVDPVVQYSWSVMMRQLLESAGYSAIKWREYAMEHSICAEEIKDIGQWLQAVKHA